MNENSNLNIAGSDVDEIDLVKIFKILLQGKFTIITFTGFFAIAAVVYSLYLPNIYQSEALLSPVGSEVGANQPQSSISGIANLAGINFSSQSGSNSTKALKKIKTLSFFKESILPNIFLPDLMAIKSWDEATNTIIYNENVFNAETQTWKEIPSPQKSFKIFKDILEVSQDRDSAFITIAIKHKSPYVAQEWTYLIVNQVNDFFRVNDRREAETAMDFLNLQIALTSYTEIKQVIAQLLQKRMQQLTLIEANQFYVFSYLDPPMVMEEKIQPNRKSICILGTLLGALLGIFIVLIREFLITKNNS
jgi:LPS O-antigen subunit length determinant protein (WzzB/FepE family)